MRISEISIKNICGIRELTVTPGRITVASGKNGEGKTSVLRALQAALGGGDLARVQTVDRETGEPVGTPEVMLSLDDGAFMVERKGADTVVRQRVGDTAALEKVRRPASFIEGLFDRDLCDPIKLIEAAPDKRLTMLLEVLPLEMTPEQIRGAVGPDLWPKVEHLASGHPLQVLTAVRRSIYDSRTGVNVSRDEKKKTIQQLKLSIPARLPEASAAGVELLEKERDEVSGRVQKVRGDAEGAYKASLAEAQGERDKEMGEVKELHAAVAMELREAAEKHIAGIRAQLETDLGNISKIREENIAVLDSRLGKRLEDAGLARTQALEAIATDQAALDALTSRLATAREQVEQNAKDRNTADMIKTFETEADSLNGESERYTAGIDAVDKLRAQVLAALPIPGLEIDGKDIFLNKVHLDMINTADQLRFAVKVVALRAKKRSLPAIFVDRIESLDAANLAAFEAAVEEEGLQAFVASRTEGPLVISTK